MPIHFVLSLYNGSYYLLLLSGLVATVIYYWLSHALPYCLMRFARFKRERVCE